MGRHVREYWLIWLGLMSGIASVILTFAVAVPETSGKAIGAWIASYVCLIVAALALLHKMHTRLRELEVGGLTEERRRLAQEHLRRLTDGDREALRALLVEHRLTGDQVRERFSDRSDVDLTRINERTPFLALERVFRDIGTVTDSWSIRSEWQGVLTSLLVAPQRWSYLSRGVRDLLRIKRAFTREGRHYRAAVRRNQCAKR
jgi:hypothetical protein